MNLYVNFINRFHSFPFRKCFKNITKYGTAAADCAVLSSISVSDQMISLLSSTWNETLFVNSIESKNKTPSDWTEFREENDSIQRNRRIIRQKRKAKAKAAKNCWLSARCTFYEKRGYVMRSCHSRFRDVSWRWRVNAFCSADDCWQIKLTKIQTNWG